MPGIYKLYTAIVALIGNVSLIAVGEVNPAFSFVGMGLLWGYYGTLRGRPALSRWGVGGLSLTTFIIFLLDAFTSGDVFLAVAHMTLIFQTIKSFDIKDPWDPLQVFFVSLLQLLIASELTMSMSFGAVFSVFLVFIVISMLLGHFVKEGQVTFGPYLRPIAVLTLITFVLTVIFFVSVPRAGGGLWRGKPSRSLKTTGFSERVDFGSFGEVKQDFTVVMRVMIRPDHPGPHYLRGMTFDFFDGAAWYDTIREKRRIPRDAEGFDLDASPNKRTFELDVYLKPIDSGVIFTFKKPYRMESPGFWVVKDASGSLYMKFKKYKRFFYKMFSEDGAYTDAAYIDRYLQLPEGTASAGDQAGRIAAEGLTDLEKAQSLRNYLIGNYRYSLNTVKPKDGVDVIEDFLFYSKKGFCEHFATAMTLMLRSVGIPARLVTGFVSGGRNDFGDYYIIRQADAHSWVEAFIDGRWMLFDPTPPVFVPENKGIALFLDMVRMNWDRYVVGFSSYDQRSLFSGLISPGRVALRFPAVFNMKIASAIAALVALFFTCVLARKAVLRTKYRGISAEYVKLRKKVLKNGGNVHASTTSDEVLKEAGKTGRFRMADAARAIEIYRKLRFSGKTDGNLMKEFYRISRRLRK